MRFFSILIIGLLLVGCKARYNQNHSRKPIIYLYPKQMQDVSVMVNYDGELTATYPEYGNGWNVTAMPDGTVIDQDGKEYSYLFWEGEREAVDKSYTTGFVVRGDEVREFLQSTLADIGLTSREYNEFVVYWYPLMMENEFNFIHFLIDEDYNSVSTMEITPAPDAMLRVFMEYKAIDGPVQCDPQSFNGFERTGFTVVEWGGEELKGQVTIVPPGS